MTVTALLARAASLANVTNAKLFDTAENEGALNAAYRDVYESICNSDDDYFIQDWAFTLASMTAVSNEPGAYYIALPAVTNQFYRLRRLEYLSGSAWVPIKKFSLRDAYRDGPAYRFKGSYLYLMGMQSSSASSFRAWYYPVPAAYTVALGTVDINTPPQLETDILAYQIAIDLKRKQNEDYSKLQQRRDELWRRFELALRNRDNNSNEHIANVYNVGEE
jgi:hypothetical protein